MSTIQERVARGAQWLDEVRPGWRDQVSLETLDVRDTHLCVCGQTFAHDVLGLPDWESGYGYAISGMGLTTGETVEFGFMWDAPTCSSSMQRECDALNAQWRATIHASRVPVESVEVEVTA